MQVREAMTDQVVGIAPDSTVQYAARRMREHDVGLLPVVREGLAVGVVSDRDIALRSTAEGLDPRTTEVKKIMTADVVQCRETDSLSDAARLMEAKKIRRLVVTDERDVVTGMLSADDLARRLNDPGVFSRVLREVGLAAPGG